MAISVEIEDPELVKNSGHTVHIFVDRDEIKQLILDLESLSRDKDYSSIRLLSKSWGNGELLERIFSKNSAMTHFLRITVTPSSPIE